MKVEKIINAGSLILVLLIIYLVIFGCNKALRTYENFENKKSSKLTEFQAEILDKIKKGVVDTKYISQMIRDNKFSKEDLDKIISHVTSQ